MIEHLWSGRPWSVWDRLHRPSSRKFLIGHQRIQHPVGQGFFHSGQLALARGAKADRVLHFVYDCGSTQRYRSARTAAVRKYLDETSRTKIDLLFVSHVHFDHVSGMEELLDANKGAKVDTIILPLIDTVHRLIVYARAMAQDPSTATSFYQDFIVDPASALASRFQPNQILFVTRGGDDPETGVDDVLPAPDRPPTDPEGAIWTLVGRGKRGDISGSYSGAPGVGKTKVFTIPDTLGLSAAGHSARSGQQSARVRAWLFKTYVDPDVVRGRAAFLRELRRQLHLTAAKLNTLISNVASLKDLVVHKRLELAKSYEAVTSDLNVTSLSLYSGPTLREAGDVWVAGRDDVVQVGGAPSRSGWLGTGDAQLKKQTARRAFLKHYAANLSLVSTLTLPHHGSEDNFHVHIMKSLRPRLCVASADTQNSWRHPATSVVQAVSSANANVQAVTAQSSPLVEQVFLT